MAEPGWSDVEDAGLRLPLVTAALLIVFGVVYLHEMAVSEARHETALSTTTLLALNKQEVLFLKKEPKNFCSHGPQLRRCTLIRQKFFASFLKKKRLLRRLKCRSSTASPRFMTR